MEEKLLTIFNQLLESSNYKKIEKLDYSLDLRNDLGLDSFQLAELTVHIEEEFGVDIFEDGLVNTIGEIVEKLNK